MFERNCILASLACLVIGIVGSLFFFDTEKKPSTFYRAVNKAIADIADSENKNTNFVTKPVPFVSLGSDTPLGTVFIMDHWPYPHTEVCALPEEYIEYFEKNIEVKKSEDLEFGLEFDLPEKLEEVFEVVRATQVETNFSDSATLSLEIKGGKTVRDLVLLEDHLAGDAKCLAQISGKSVLVLIQVEYARFQVHSNVSNKAALAGQIPKVQSVDIGVDLGADGTLSIVEKEFRERIWTFVAYEVTVKGLDIDSPLADRERAALRELENNFPRITVRRKSPSAAQRSFGNVID